jgi:hypothetical protein
MEGNMKKLFVFALILFVAAGSHAALNWSYGWEDGSGTALGTYGNVGTLENSTEQAQEGTRSLKAVEDPIGGTPQIFVWWVTGLSSGDVVTASFYCYDTTPGGSPSGRIWGHYTDGLDIDSYQGSAGGNDTYSDGSGWTNLQYDFNFVSSGTDGRTGLVIEARMYCAADPLNVLYYDNTHITVSRESAVIHRADGATIPEPAFLGLLPLALLFFRRK